MIYNHDANTYCGAKCVIQTYNSIQFNNPGKPKLICKQQMNIRQIRAHLEMRESRGIKVENIHSPSKSNRCAAASNSLTKQGTKTLKNGATVPIAFSLHPSLLITYLPKHSFKKQHLLFRKMQRNSVKSNYAA